MREAQVSRDGDWDSALGFVGKCLLSGEALVPEDMPIPVPGVFGSRDKGTGAQNKYKVLCGFACLRAFAMGLVL